MVRGNGSRRYEKGIASPAVAFVGRHNSGKTTLIERVIAELTARGFSLGSVKHHSHRGFDIDIPGKDSYRHRAAGSVDVVIAAPGQIARVTSLEGELECREIIATMPGHDLVVVEGYRKSGLPTIEVMRTGNKADQEVARAFLKAAQAGKSLSEDFVQQVRGREAGIEGVSENARADMSRAVDANADTVVPGISSTCTPVNGTTDLDTRMPGATTVAVVSDIPEAYEAATLYGIPVFGLDDTKQLCDFLEEEYVRCPITVAIQAGGESRRMGQSKATVLFDERPLMCRIIERIAPVADHLIITTNEGENLRFVQHDYPELNIQLVPDVYDIRGALPGIYSALLAAPSEYVALVACDMVCVSPALIAHQASVMAALGVDVVVPVNKHGYEPFHALYRKSTCLPAVRAAIEAGKYRAQAFYDAVKVYEMPQSEVLQAEPMGGCFVNVNTPEELRIMEKAFARSEKETGID